MPSLTHNTPALRFPGYTGVWEQKQLEDVVTVYSGRDYKGIPAGNIPVYGTGGYMRSISQALSDNNDAIGIGRKGTIDHPFILKAPFWTVDTLFYCVPQHDYDLDFIYGLYQKVPWKALDESTGVPSLSKIAINHIKVLLPSLSEQRKIGSFFRHVDGLINLHQRQTQTLKKLKQGLLQKMFPQDGESVPRLRFPGFTDTWKQQQLGNIATFINGRAYSQDELLEHGRYPVLRVGNFYTNDSWYYSDLELADKYYAHDGDLLYTWSATFGPHIWHGDTVIYHYHIWKIDLSHALNKLFALYLLEYDKNNLLENHNGSTMVHITKAGIENEIVLIPSDIQEQKQIGSFFRTLDDLIHLHKQYVTTLIHLKKGLLQTMFPQD